jgi:hypothetical protein
MIGTYALFFREAHTQLRFSDSESCASLERETDFDIKGEIIKRGRKVTKESGRLYERGIAADKGQVVNDDRNSVHHATSC